MAFGAKHEEPAGTERLVLQACDLGADFASALVLFALARIGNIGQFLPNPHVGITAELSIGAAAGHICCDRDRAGYASLCNDLRFLLVIAGVEDREYLGFGGAFIA